jgi:hypothetical protein
MTTLTNRLKTSLRRAHRVMDQIHLGSLSTEEAEEIVVEAYANCREQGYAAYVRGLTVDVKLVWCECRGSDEMVCYVGTSANFETAGNIPDYTTYEYAKRFSNLKGTKHAERFAEERCADFIQKLLVPAAKAAVKEMAVALKAKAKRAAELADHDSDYYTKPVTPGGHTQWYMENDITHG